MTVSLVATATRHANGAWPDLVRGGQMTHSATGTITVDGKSYNFDVSRRTVKRPGETGVDYVAVLYNPGSARELTAPKHESVRSALIQAFKRKVQAMAGDTRTRGEDWNIGAETAHETERNARAEAIGFPEPDFGGEGPAPAVIRLSGGTKVPASYLSAERVERETITATSDLDALPVETVSQTPVRIGTIDCTPTWEGLVPAFLALIENGNAEGRATAVAEITRMAKAADKANAYREQRDTESARAVAAENSVQTWREAHAKLAKIVAGVERLVAAPSQGHARFAILGREVARLMNGDSDK